MKVKCLNNSNFEDTLTEGKDYIVLCFKSWSEAQIINDKEESQWYGLDNFTWSEAVYE